MSNGVFWHKDKTNIISYIVAFGVILQKIHLYRKKNVLVLSCRPPYPFFYPTDRLRIFMDFSENE